MRQFLTVSSVTLPPKSSLQAKRPRLDSGIGMPMLSLPKNNFASPRSRPPWSSDRPTRCVCCVYHQTTSIQPDTGGNTSHKNS